MPTYEYRCRACGCEWETEQRITEPATKQCNECDEDQAERLIPSRTGFALVGGGWATDRYASTKPR